MKVHQPNLPAPGLHPTNPRPIANMPIPSSRPIRGSAISSKRSVQLGLDKNTYIIWTTDNGAWQDVYPDFGYTPFRGTKGTVREGGNRVPVDRLGAEYQTRGHIATISSEDWISWPPLRG